MNRMELNYIGRSRGGGYSGKSWMQYTIPVHSKTEAIEKMNELKDKFPTSVKNFEFSRCDEYYLNCEKENLI